MREPRPEPGEPARKEDAWSRAWGAPALRDLGRYLVANGTSAENAALLMEQIWIFYSYEMLPVLGRHTPLAISAKAAETLPRIALTLLINVVDEHEAAAADDEIARLRSNFRPRFVEPLAPFADLTAHVTKVLALPGQTFPPSPWEMSLTRHEILRSGNWDFVAVYIDDLVSELATIMDPDDVTPWLNTPNLMFGGLAPRALLGTADEHLLRDVVTRAKFNLPAA